MFFIVFRRSRVERVVWFVWGRFMLHCGNLCLMCGATAAAWWFWSPAWIALERAAGRA